MKYPSLVPDKICRTQVTIYQTDGLNRDGSPKKSIIFEGKCFYSEKTRTKLTADKQLITLSGEMLFNSDISPDTDVITGTAELLSGIRRVIHSSQKAKNPDGTVNYTRLELI